ncbi:precorrin-8X methylmutase [Trichlorobacter ammonificans]|uniref:precorrin-8X methylmutase n=1 Tax=Trichlorobacter ammonificans TaxID=2916410 RepID=UPI00286947C3|nr:precorrin-8X methylmutase [Trichlorobacter ammonificans]
MSDSRGMNPEEIEAASFRIIDEEAGGHDWSPEQWPVVRRVIHTSADYEYLQSLVMTPDAVTAAVTALRAGRSIVTDTTMALAGIRKDLAGSFGCRLSCNVAAADVAEAARHEGITRSVAAMRRACRENSDGIFVIGNAPTALFELMEQVRNGTCLPALIVGLPVGFVGAEESKNALASGALGVPFITNMGRKGGSTVAAAVMNALLLRAAEA